jgi:hypothetical protein
LEDIFSDLEDCCALTPLLLPHTLMHAKTMNSNFSTSYSIYILQDSKTANYQIGYTTNNGNDATSNDGACHAATNEGKLMYLRMFDDFVDAFGHKLFLEQISIPSLRRFVRMHNPDLNDLRETILSTGDNATNEATTVRIDNYNNTK